MTASTKNRKEDKKKRASSFGIFLKVLLFVLSVGGIFLACMGRHQKNERVLESSPPLLEEVKMESVEAEASPGDLVREEVPDESRYGKLPEDPEALKAQNIYVKEAANEEETVIAFAGDILFDPYYATMANLIQRGGAVEQAFSPEILDEMRNADVFMVNNEFPYTNRGTPLEGKTFTFRAEPERAQYLTQMGVDIVSLANNHASDYGEVSLLDSLDTLEKMEMPYVGAGRNLEEASRPVSFLINDKKIAIVSATQIERNDNPDTKGATEDRPGTFRCWNPEKLLSVIGEAKQENDFVIVYIHWGTENQAETDWAQDEQAVKIAQAGADVIIGAHPHCLQPVGFVGEVPVVYSLGNFWFNSKTLDTAMAQVIITKEDTINVKILPAKQSDCRTSLLGGEERQRVLQYINSISSTGYLDEEGFLIKG